MKPKLNIKDAAKQIYKKTMEDDTFAKQVKNKAGEKRANDEECEPDKPSKRTASYWK